MIGKVVTGCVAIFPYHTPTQDRGSECRDFGFISRIVTALLNINMRLLQNKEMTVRHDCDQSERVILQNTSLTSWLTRSLYYLYCYLHF